MAAVVSPPAPTETKGKAANAAPTISAVEEPTTAPASDPPPSAAPTPSAVVTPSTAATPTVETRTATEKQRINYKTRTVEDSSLPKGTRKVTTRGVPGVRTLTYEITLTDGVQTGKKLVRSQVTKAPVTEVVRIGTKKERQCDPNYSGCVPIASDVDCAGGSGNGPAYVYGPVRVIGEDIYDLDRDGDGIGCDD
ncbi:G5 domain-containing protein [Micromonospora olivasterospora]|uniref:Surface rod structure-forming protein G n=1 Tax=Micromonospora olivasterospora TaxID=1880 RepID=A0A562I5D7_MICOL|nr:G5 domain-containing protein [Micromonospora olivasterospora]TWH65914.1 surface rod structure-forming protein G [Micromonospora olivasterospora]